MSSNLLLHSSDHPTIDYTAQEESGLQDDLLKHYIGIYDPENEKLKLIPARGVTVRRTLRQHGADDSSQREANPSQDVHLPAPPLPLHPLIFPYPLVLFYISNYKLNSSSSVSLKPLRLGSRVWDQEIQESNTLPYRKCHQSNSREIRAGIISC